MVDDTLFYTLAQPNSLQQEIKKSRFLAHAGAVDSIEAAMAFVAGHGVAAANHNCWAYQVGDAYRFSDDGEPAGTAGRPILHAIESQRCDRVAVLVVRWFGGIKLGAGGLECASRGISAQCWRSGARVPLLDRGCGPCR